MLVVLANEKGGTGKTTVAVGLACAWARRHRVVLVDTDSQESAASNLIAKATHILDKIRRDDEKREGQFPGWFLDPEHKLEICQPTLEYTQTRVP
jgi:cellulose biosynthesis protein BcsQ